MKSVNDKIVIMSVLGALGVYSRSDDWLVAGVAVLLSYLIIYPTYVYFLRNRHSRRIISHLVTSAYKLPINMTPTELSYIFSPKVGKNQLYSTLLDLTNRSLLIMDKKDKATLVSIGPKIDDKIHSFEKFLVDKVKNSDRPLSINKLLKGEESYENDEGEKVSGSFSYIYWWLQRKSLRSRKIIEKRMTGKYAFMLFKFAVVGGLFVSIVPLLFLRFVQMLDSGEVDLAGLFEHVCNGFIFWIIGLVPLIIISFALLRFRGKMLGRAWLLTSSYRRYLGQIDAFREFVRLSHNNKLRFESRDLKKESVASTRPYAIACGYVKP